MENMVRSKSNQSSKRVSLSSRQPTPIEHQDLTEHIKTVKRYAHNIASRHYEISSYYDELLSLGMYELFKSLRVYDYKRGEFKPFLVNIYCNMLKFANRLKRKNAMCCSFDDNIEDTAISHGSNTEDADNRLMVQQVLSLLTESERKIIVDKFYHDRTLEQIANDFGLSKERIRQKINCILQKMERRLR